MCITYICMGLLVTYVVYVVRLICILPYCRAQNQEVNPLRRSLKRSGNLHVFVFLGSGGHTGEMLRLLENYSELLLAKDNRVLIGYSDERSRLAFERLATKRGLKCDVEYYEFVKAREVNSSISKSIITILKTLLDSCIKALSISLKFIRNPHLVLLNGPGTCCILALWFKLFELANLFQPRSNIVYIESLARITTLSLSGKFLYWLADSFIVQWIDLKNDYPRSEYYGILV